MSFLDLARRGYALETKAADVPIYGPGGFAGGTLGGSLQPASIKDYRAEVGELYKNAIVSICLNAMVRKLSQTRLVRQQLQKDYSLLTQDDDAAVKAVQRASDSYGEDVLWSGVLLSTKTNGNGYWIKRPDRLGRTAGYFWADVRQVEAKADRDPSNVPNDGRKLVTRYVFTPIGGGKAEDLWPEKDLIHFRWPMPDPTNPILGMSELAYLYRQVHAHNQIVTHDANLHQNAGMPGVMFIPKAGGEIEAPTPAQKTRLERLWSLFSGEGYGRPFTAPFPIDVHSPAFPPDKLLSTTSRNINAAEICAALGMDPMAVHLFSENKTYSNFDAALEDFTESAMLPTLNILAAQFTRSARADFGVDDPSVRYGFDLSNFRELQEDEDKRHKRIREDFKANILTLNETRKLLGQTEVDGGERLWSDIAGSAVQAPAEADTAAKRLERIRELQADLLGSAAKAKSALEAIDADRSG